MKRLLIIGGTGFIGYHLALKAIKKKWKVTSVSTKPPKKKRKVSKVNYIILDIARIRDFKKINLNFDYIVNLGGYVDHSNSKKTYLSHYVGCKNLANFFLKKKIKKFIQIGSSLEYGHLKSPQKENYKTNIYKLKSIYAKSKLRATNYLQNLYHKYKFPFTVVRLFLVYGKNQDYNRLIPYVIKKCLKDKRFEASGGEQIRDFLYIDDLISALFKILNEKKTSGEIINIASGKPSKVKYIINLIIKIANGGKANFGKIKLRKDENLKMYANIQKAKKIINWRPRTGIVDGINRCIKSMA